jgi:ATP-dependent DNA helicase PIF1
MISKDIIQAVDRSFRDICKEICDAFKDIPFGGHLIVFGGDFRQVLPVIPKASRADIDQVNF